MLRKSGVIGILATAFVLGHFLILGLQFSLVLDQLEEHFVGPLLYYTDYKLRDLYLIDDEICYNLRK